MATSITPISRSLPSGTVFYTWVNIRCKNLPRVGQDSVQINKQAKSWGDRPQSASGFNEAAHEHADDRLSQGFGINDVVAEYRALRASVAPA
jgi:hypothetical protein